MPTRRGISYLLGEYSEIPITLDSIVEARFAAKLNIIKAQLNNLIQTYETQNQKMKGGAPDSEQPTTAHPPL